MAAGDVLAALWIALSGINMPSILYATEPQDFVPGRFAEPVSWIALTMAAGMLLATAGVIRGRATARTLLLAIFTLLAAAAVWDTVCTIVGLSRMGYPFPLNWSGVWFLATALKFVFLAAANVWYLKFSRAREFMVG